MGGEQGMEALSLGMFPREACLSSCAGHGAIMKGWSRSREERMDEEFFFLILFLDLCKLHPGRREWLNPPRNGQSFPGHSEHDVASRSVGGGGTPWLFRKFWPDASLSG